MNAFRFISRMLPALGLLTVGGIAAAGRVVLVEDGQPRAVIVMADDAPRNTVTAVGELRDYLERMSGALLPVQPDVGGATSETRIWIGGHPDLAGRVSGLDLTFAHPEEILIAARDGGDLVLAGNDASGSGTALTIYTFIQDVLGVRWLWPGELGEDVPEQSTLAFEPFTIRQHPIIRQRNYRHRPVNQDPSQSADDLRRWMVRQRMGHGFRSFSMSAGHAFTDWWERFGAEHPEYFALQPDGTRGPYNPGRPDGVKLCVSNPGVHERWLAEAERQLARGSEGARVLSASKNDWAHMGVCTCADCRAWDHPDGRTIRLRWAGGVTAEQVALTDRYVRFWNILARGVKSRFPERDILVGAWAYQENASPPVGVALEDNIVIGFVDGHPGAYGGFFAFPSDLRQQDREMWRRWAASARYMVWRPNLGHTVTAGLALPQLPLRRSVEDFRFLADHAIVGLDIDSVGGHWATQGVQQYLIARLAWDPYADAEAILKDYFHRGFGPAAGPIESYYTHLETLFYQFVDAYGSLPRFDQYQRFVEVYTPQALAAVAAHLREAEALVAGVPERFQRRVAFVRIGFDFIEALMQSYGAMAEVRARPADIVAGVRRAKAAADRVDALVAKGEADHALSTGRTRNLARDYFGPPNDDLLPLLRVDDLLDGYALPWIETSRRWGFKLETEPVTRPDGAFLQSGDWDGLRVHTAYSWSHTFRDTDPALAAKLKGYHGAGWYHTRFRVPEEMLEREIYLFFGGVSDDCRVFVNGEPAGQRITAHPDDWREPFVIRIDPHIDPERALQDITVRVVRHPGSEGPGGIYRQPWMVSCRP